jgi:D-glycero-beta-D-manno-heptose 1-phosphate adenylyltransferase
MALSLGRLRAFFMDRDASFYIILKYWAPLIRWRSMLKITHPDAKVVATNGCFDILHAGHISMLESAATFGNFLVVGLNGDESVRQLKGPTRPVNNEDDRKKVLSALRCVDFVHVFPEERATRFLMVAKPHVYIKAGDYSLETMDKSEREVLERMGTTILFTGLVPGLSTTNILKSL